MITIKPSYFEKFSCIADKCPNTCCAGWQIMIDETSLDRYAKETSAFRGRLHASIDWSEGCFKEKSGRCIFLNEKNLCDLYTALGEEALCHTCTMYPRHVEEFEGVREYSLSLSCPEAARIMLEETDPIRYLTEEDDVEETEEYEDYDPFFYEQLSEIRDAFFAVANNRNLSQWAREEIILSAAKRIQEAMDAEDSDTLWREADALRDAAEIKSDPAWTADPSAEMFIKELGLLKSLELINEDWEKTILRAEELLTISAEASDSVPEAMRVPREVILHFFLFSYFCGAVYDGYTYARAALCVKSTRWIALLSTLCFEGCLSDAAILYAREVEHSDENVSLMLEWLDKNS